MIGEVRAGIRRLSRLARSKITCLASGNLIDTLRVGALRSVRQAEQARDRDVFVKSGPVDCVAVAVQLEVLAIGVGGVPQPGKPFERARGSALTSEVLIPPLDEEGLVFKGQLPNAPQLAA